MNQGKLEASHEMLVKKKKKNAVSVPIPESETWGGAQESMILTAH